MDALKALIQFPIYYSFSTLRFATGLVAVTPIIALDLVSKRGKSKIFKKHTKLYELLKSAPFGSHFFDGVVGLFAPYTTSINSHVTECKPGFVQIQMYERPWLKNPFNSIHAVALTNLGEFASGLSMVCSMQETNGNVRGIISKIETTYMKKARGIITATSTSTCQDVVSDCERIAEAILTDASGEQVAICKCTWNLKVKNKEGEGDKKKK